MEQVLEGLVESYGFLLFKYFSGSTIVRSVMKLESYTLLHGCKERNAVWVLLVELGEILCMNKMGQ